MSVHENDSSTWKATWPSINVAGTFEDAQSTTDGVEAVFVKVGSAWRMVWPIKSSVPSVSAIAVSASGPVSASIVIQTDGRIKEAGTGTTYEDYADNAPDTDKGGAADTLFQYKWEPNPDTPDTVPVASGTWTDLTGDATFTQTDTTADDGLELVTFTIHIRAKDAPLSEISFAATITVNWLTT